MPNKPLRRDAALNRRKLLEKATVLFAEQGLDGSLEEVARQAGVSIGTLYNHFPDRAALAAEILPQRITAFTDMGAKAAADPDPWHGLVIYVTGMLEHLVGDRGLMEVLTQTSDTARQFQQACHEGLAHLATLRQRAQNAGVLRADVTDTDLANVIWSLSMLGNSANEDAWRRCLTFTLDGLRTDA